MKGGRSYRKALGLQERWGEVLETLRRILPFYDDMNSMMSFGKDLKLRYKGVEGAHCRSGIVLDAGSGPGVMATIALLSSPSWVVLLDPLPEMLMEAKVREPSLRDCIVGIFEDLPLRDRTFDCVLCGFSLRDAKDLRRALSELLRVCKESGRLVIVDLGKPDGILARILVELYWCLVVPLLALIKLGKLGWRYRMIYETYKRWPTVKELKALLKEAGFSKVSTESSMMGGAIIAKAERLA